MKKSVILLIALIYAAALLFVGFLGRNPKVFEEIIPVERVEITNQALAEHSIFGKYTTITPDAKGRMQYQIEYKVYPEEATTKTVSFRIEASPEGCATIDEKTGLLVFSGQGLVKVFVIADDGSTAQDSFTVIGNGVPSATN